MPGVRCTVLENHGDRRGSSHTLPAEVWRFLGRILDGHVMTVEPGATRGDHYHPVRREILIVQHTDAWSVHWDEGEATGARQRRFEGAGAVLVEVEPLAAHAIRNDGARELYVTALSDGAFDPDRPDARPRPVSG